ncbi:hypothetical protein GCM10027062_02400 [Nocardioides hungaricus]
MPAMTRGPLPARVYWVRRLMVLGTAVLLVVAIGRLLGDGSDASSGEGGTAAQVAAETTPSTTYSAPAPPTPKRTRTPDPTPTLAVPVGECDGADIAVTPQVEDAVAGRDVRVVLQLRTLESPACTWDVGPDALTMDITSGSDAIWSSRQCPAAIPKEPVVVRQAVTSKVEVVWKEAKRSGEECTRLTDWAMPGWYHVTAAALGGEPANVQFQLVKPTAATITRTAEPTQGPTQSPSKSPSGEPSQKPSGRPVVSQSPSGAVEPD